jgi:hypothetical protein
VAYKIPKIERRRDRKEYWSYGDCSEVGNPTLGTTRYCVTCDATKNGKRVRLEHPWRAPTKEAAIAKVKTYGLRVGFTQIQNCKAIEIPGSDKE